MTRLAVMGVGRIGGEVAYLAAATGLVDELVLCDLNEAFLRAQILDIEHTGLPVDISLDVRKIRDADICLFAAGIPRTPNVKTRADLLAVNYPATRKCASILEGFPGILISVTNPMDVNNYLLHHLTRLPRERCIGFGGQLDSARFGLALKKRGLGGDSAVLGEHGEFQVPVFSKLGYEVNETVREEILRELRGASMEVIKGKGGTVFGPAYHLKTLISMILSDKKEIITASAVLSGEYGITGCSLGVPVRIGREGIKEIISWDLDKWEQEKLAAAGAFVRDLCSTVVP